jgi:pSer/pThr/pTyr-binding forkhead associated (FHA) protein
VTCPVCGAAAIPGEAFCDNCGASLLPSYSYTPLEQSAPAQANQPVPMQQPGSYVPLVVQRSATLVVINPPPPATLSIPDLAELIVGRSDPQSNSYPDVDLGPYGGLDLGVSRRHFRMSRNGDQFYVEDLNSVNGTVVNGQRIPSHNLHPLRSGDQISLGKMELRFEMG